MNKKNTLWISVILFFILACGFGGGASDSCTGTVTADGESFIGKAKDEKQAKLNACNKFCLEKDGDFEARYQIWLDSPAGRSAKKTAKKDAIYEDSGLLDYLTETCSPKCVKKAESEGRLTTDCKK